jgi:hypothetical protein
VFGSIFGLGTAKGDVSLIWIAFVLSFAIVLFVRLYTLWFVDRAIVGLYPRIVALELILGYYFYRNYLRNLGPTEGEFVRTCERIKAKNTNDLWNMVQSNFHPLAFPARRRGHISLNIVALRAVAGFLVGAIYGTLESLAG